MNSNDDSNNSAESDTSLAETLGTPETEFVTGEEKKKIGTSTLVMTGMVLAAVGATYFMMVKAGPNSAQAKTETVAAGQTINQFLNEKNKNLKTMQTMLRDTEEVVNQFQTHPTATQVPLTELATNPFRTNTQLAKSEENEAQLKRKRDTDRAAAMAAVQNLSLQSVTYGNARRTCLVNGHLYSEGDSVDAFVIERINSKSVVVRKDIYRYEISMARED